ncbi:MAG: hypothetical protein E7A11_18400 [Clostridium sp.]|uniref:hypothetical protein n=1 Tax=Clostridium sp. TaxID=1506 RepID=UPI0029004CD0|nr:hypothetical protein [Clostridium sp.]MDU1110894.1 hypothetical protein [Staphylococcus epidermidis]MBS7131852.1 hypothetical protein [Clostridium sp.]MDU1127224.1 hypothetical protein [Clostridium sp.]MDU2284206.1 hypothetical protein [Clostridium sp.]MDU3678329.1 hypothetical protein [Clostridium sp.]
MKLLIKSAIYVFVIFIIFILLFSGFNGKDVGLVMSFMSLNFTVFYCTNLLVKAISNKKQNEEEKDLKKSKNDGESNGIND